MKLIAAVAAPAQQPGNPARHRGETTGHDLETGASRPRLREIGISIGVLPPGQLNAITDVAGVAVGHRTIIEGDSIRNASSKFANSMA